MFNVSTNTELPPLLDNVIDPFCEKRFWLLDQHKDLIITNPISASTGFVIMALAICTTNIAKTDKKITRSSVTLFYLCRASLGIVGAGTIVFHSIDDTNVELKQLNFRMCDWLPIVLMCTNILVLYITKFEEDASEFCLTFMFTSMYIWTSVLVLAVDSMTYEYLTLKMHDPSQPQSMYGTTMNIVLLIPLGVVLFTASVSHFKIMESVWIWSCIAVNLVLWISNAYACGDNLWLAVLHAVYHATIAYTFICAACLGMTIDKKWEIYYYGYLWPMIRQIEVIPPQPKPLVAVEPEKFTPSSQFMFDPKSHRNISLFDIKIDNIKSL